MKNKKLFMIAVFFLIGVLLVSSLSLVSGQYTRSNPQRFISGGASGGISGLFSGGGSSGDFDTSMCEAGKDFVVQTTPLGCSPAVVRSDLLEEQNVPVFCKLSATKLNPLIDVDAIENIDISSQGGGVFQSGLPEEVAGVSFHPARAALSTRENINRPVLDNIGYVVLTLKQQPNESAMPDSVKGNLTANIQYDVENAFGVGEASFQVPQLDDSEWGNQFNNYGFWGDKGFLRVGNIVGEQATVSVYDNNLRKVSDFNLQEGETSREFSIPGFDFCTATSKVRLDDVKAPDTRARFKINDDVAEISEGERFLQNKCRVLGLEKQGLVQDVEIMCDTDNGRQTFELQKKPRVDITIEEESGTYEVGDLIYEWGENEEKRIFLGHIGQNASGNPFIVPVVSAERNKEGFLDSFAYKTLSAYVNTILFSKRQGTLSRAISEGVRAEIGVIATGTQFVATGAFPAGIFYQGKDNTDYMSEIMNAVPGIAGIFGGKASNLPEINFKGFAGAQDAELEGQIKENYENAKEDYQEVVENFPGEKYPENSQTVLGEEALYQQITLARDAGQKRTMVELCNKFKEGYPESNKELSFCENQIEISNSEFTTRYININGKTRKISFEGIFEPTLEEYGAEIVVSNAENYSGTKTLGKNQEFQISGNESIVLREVREDSIILGIENVNQGGFREATAKATNTIVDLNDFRIVGANQYRIELTDINLEKVAKVSVLPEVNNKGTEVDFNFEVGIEKRAIQLSDEKINEKLDRINNSIEKWEDISSGLNKTVRGLRKACFATQGALIAKNFVQNLRGEGGIARQVVMRGESGWYERCTDLVNQGEFDSQDSCLLENNNEIEDDVETMQEIIKNQGNEIKEIQSEYTEEGGFLQSDVVDDEKFMEDYTPRVESSLDNLGDEITNPDNPSESISISEIKGVINIDGWKEGKFSTEQARDIELYSRIINSDADESLKGIAREKLYSTLSDVKANSKNFAERNTISQKFDLSSEDFAFVEEKEGAEQKSYSGKTNEDIGNIINHNNVTGDTPVQFSQTNDGRVYILVLDDRVGAGRLPIKRDDEGVMVYDTSGNRIPVDLLPVKIKNSQIYFKEFDEGSYNNEYKNAEVRFYETEPYQGLPAIVPFDTENGWYAATKQNLPVGRQIRSYDASGRVNSFWLCNVGNNGLEEFFSGLGDDNCQQINLGTGQPYNQFEGLNEQEAVRLVGEAQDAIAEASRQHSAGIRRIVINGQRIEVGEPAADIPNMKCQDFMSPKECNLIFNLCDPVVCPSSRCDLGGAYPVRDVAQTGIIGSTLLCLPNFPETKIPVCLTGIKAGVDNWISTQSAYQQCLQENLETGRTVGICDEIHSVYMCEMFWRQAQPLTEIGISRIAEGLSGQGTRGGGEYLSVQNAFQNTRDSVDFFTNQYGSNVFDAFEARSTQEVIGSAICKNFASLRAPDDVNIIDKLAEPESPPQFSGRFDEIPFTTATSPPTSQYKVFYKIFAGKNEGAYYRIYLRRTSESSFYQDVSSVKTVDSGFIPVGQTVAETRDFTAASGYKQLCINVNGQEECGFKEVSTSFAVNYARDRYLANQVNQTNIQTEEECVSGKPSARDLLNPNIQEGVGDVIDPQVYDRGITRICATGNPGKGSDAFAEGEDSRWKDVGYCGNERIRCWLDTESVEDVIKNSNIEGEALQEVSDRQQELLSEKGFLTSEEFSSEVDNIEDEEELDERLEKINDIMDEVFYNAHKAYSFLLRGNVYKELAIRAYQEVIEEETETEQSSSEEETEDTEQESAETGIAAGEQATTEFTSPIYYNKDITFKQGVSKGAIFKFERGQWYWSHHSEDISGWTSVSETEGGEFQTKLEFQGEEGLEQTEGGTVTLEVSDWVKEWFEDIEGSGYEEGLNKMTTQVINHQRNCGNVLGFIGFCTEFSRKNEEGGDMFELRSDKRFTISELGGDENVIIEFSDNENNWQLVVPDRDVKTLGTNRNFISGRYNLEELEGDFPSEVESLINNLENKNFFDGAVYLLKDFRSGSDSSSRQSSGVSGSF